jgi:hypothetical protein
MFHLHNGDSTADTMRAANFPGTHFAFREALTSGATPAGLSLDEWCKLRARALSGLAEQEAVTIEQELRAQAATLNNLAHHDEIILWFEHDLFCQTHLIYLLDHFARHPVTTARLSLICINAFPGKPDFRGLGELTAEQMASLFDTRHAITPAEFELAQRAWAVYSSPDPQTIADLLDTDTTALPYLREAWLLHLGRFPSVMNGLNQAENMLLTLIAAGHRSYLNLCPAFFNAMPAYGLGDLAIREDLQRMANAPQPLLALNGLDDSDWRNATCALTETGWQVLAHAADFVALNGIDRWLGGVHLTDQKRWRWNAQSLRLERN